MPAEVTQWLSSEAPTRAGIELIFTDKCLSARWWSNGPGDRYETHAHPYHKLLLCYEGSVVFRLEAESKEVELHAGDRLGLSPGTRHSAVVGPHGVTCAEAAIS
jgi:quercetin dioxygenase-like cupin family protein